MEDAMFQNAAIDVAIALVLMYLMLSLLCTVINEFIATKLQLRAKSLASALEKLVDSDALRDTFYRHGLIVATKRAIATTIVPESTLSGLTSAAVSLKNMLGAGQPAHGPSDTPAKAAADPNAPVATAPAPPAKEDHPSYLSGRTVALALIGSLDPSKPLPGIQDIENAVKGLAPSHVRDALLASLTEANKDLDKLRTSIATWFDDSMDRLSGAYKRQLKWISMLIGLLVAIAFNADSFKVATTLWNDGDRRAAAVQIATTVAQQPAPPVQSTDDLQKSIEKTENTLRSLPIGWQCDVKPSAQAAGAGQRAAVSGAQSQQPTAVSWRTCIETSLESVNPWKHPLPILGWLLTAVALSLGAPFWFDLLIKFVNVRGAGAKPEREDAKKKSS